MSIKQNFPVIDSSLNLDFANSRVVDSRITFTRASAATHTNALGVLQTLRDNKPRIDFDASTGECRGLLIEEQRTNKAAYSSEFSNAFWQIDGGGTLVADQGIAPDGSLTADMVRESTSSGIGPRLIKTTPWSDLASTTFTFSIFAKSFGTKRNVFLLCQAGALAFYGHFDIVAGTVVQASNSSTGVLVAARIENTGNGWFRISITGSVPSSDIYMMTTTEAVGGTGFGGATYTGDGSSGVLYWGAQTEVGSFPTSYIPTTPTFTSRAGSAYYYDSVGTLRIAGTNQPRYGYGYDSTTNKWVSQGLILEAAATNLITRSDMQANWNVPNAGYTYSTQTTAPDGSTIYSINKNTTYQVLRLGSLFTPAALTYPATFSLSFWAKTLSGTGTLGWDIGDGTGSAAGSASLTTSWQRFTYTVFATSAATFPSGGFLDFGIPDNNTFAIWGVQLETGGTATSYIPTFGATATRAADVSSSAATTRAAETARIAGNLFASIYNKTNSTLLIDSALPDARSVDRYVATITDSSLNTNAIHMRTYNTTSAWQSYTQSTNNGTVTGTVGAGNIRVAGSINAAGMSLSTNGSAASASAALTMPVLSNPMLLIGSDTNGTNFWNGWVKRISYYPIKVTNTQLQALTV
jgi:hypothetical protein